MTARNYTTRTSVLDIISQYAPGLFVKENPRSEKERWECVCLVCHYESGTSPRPFKIHANGIFWNCMVCGHGGGPRKLVEHLTGIAPIDVQVTRPSSLPTAAQKAGKDANVRGFARGQY